MTIGPDVRRPQVGHEQLRSAGDVEWQEAVVIVVAMEEVLLLMAMNGIVGGINVECQFLGRRVERGDELIDENSGDADEIVSRDAIFKSAESGCRTEFSGAIDFGMVGGRLPEWFESQMFVIVEVFMPLRQRVDALGENRLLRMNDAFGHAGIGDGSVGRSGESDLLVSFAQKQESGIGGEVPSGKLGGEFAAIDSGKRQGSCGTVCHRDGRGCGEEVLL